MNLTASSPLQFRRATEADIAALVELVTSAYRGDASRQGWTTEADLLGGQRIAPEVLRDNLSAPRSCIALVERDGELLGCAHVCDQDGVGYFGMFAVRPTLQNAGIGRALLAEAERIAAGEWGLPMMRMQVIDLREELIAWYVRRGYRRTGAKAPFPATDPRFGLPRRDDLRFEILEKPL
ncbi:MAG: GNAT family N-acetyltransferase [Lysobacteraceae bacterium]